MMLRPSYFAREVDVIVRRHVPYLTTRLANPGAAVEYFSLGLEPETWEVHIFCRKGVYLGEPELKLIQIAKEQFGHESLV